MVRLVAVVLLVFCATGLSASAVPALTSANSVTYDDERNEAPGAPDITSVTVSNDDAGQIAIRIATPGHQRLTQDMRIRVFLTVRGKEYFLLVDPFKLPAPIVGLYRCEPRPGGAVCSTLPGSPSLTFSYSRRARFTFDASEIGIEPRRGTTIPITFSVLTYAGIGYDPVSGYDLTNVKIDGVPASRSQSLTYVAAFGPPRLAARSLVTLPRIARAGRPLEVRMRVVRRDLGVDLTSGQIMCTAKAGAKDVVARTGRFVGTHATCVFAVPRGASGARLIGAIAVRFDGETVRRSFVRRIR